MAYDAFGEYTGGQRDPYEEERIRQEEEDRKRREEQERLARAAQVAQPEAFTGQTDEFGGVDAAVAQQAALAPVAPDQVIKKEQVETRADGSQVVKTTEEVPGGAVAPAATPTPMAPPVAAAPVTATVPAAAPAPAAPLPGLPSDYNQRIAQMESGGREDIGYHDRSKSSAFGKYGITDKAWTDAQRANPALAGVRKDQATPEQMEAAQTTVTANNARFLGKLGVEVNPNTLAAAHFIGAQGLANYLRDGSISPGAIKANGGYEKTKQIIDQRLGGAFAPASGAAQRAQPPAAAPVVPGQFMGGQPGFDEAGTPIGPGGMPGAPAVTAPGAVVPEAISPYSLATGAPATGLRMPTQPAPVASPSAAAISTYQAIQDDPMALLKLRQDPEAPAFIRERAGAQAYDLLNRERKTAAAEAQVEKMVTAGDQTGIAKTLASKPKTEEGSFLKAVLYARLNLTDLAAEEQRKLGAGTKWTSVAGPDGENALVKIGANGRPLEGVKSDGTAFTDSELVKFGGMAGVKLTKPDVSMQDVEKNGQKGRVVTTYDRNNKPTTVVESGGQTFKYDASWKPTSIGTAAEKAETAAGIKLRYAGPTAYTEAGAKAAGEFNFQHGTNIGYTSQQPGAPLVDLNTGKPVQVGAGGVISVTQTGTPGAGAPAAAAAPAGQIPAAPAAGQTPAQMAQREAVGKVAQEQFVKTTVPAVLEQGNNGREIATARRQQVSIIENNPSILDIYNGSGTQYDQARNVISKLLTGAYNENNSGDFYKDVKATGLSTNERSAMEQMWNLTSGINGKTLKTNTGGGPISNADMKVNRDANLQNFTETTPLGALQVINRSKFTGDLDTAKAAFIAKNPTLTDDVKFTDAWSKESARYTKAYEGIADARAQFLKPFAPPRDATKEQLSMFRDKVFKSFEMYPVPAYDTEAGKWSYGTANAERAAAKKLLGR